MQVLSIYKSEKYIFRNAEASAPVDTKLAPTDNILGCYKQVCLHVPKRYFVFCFTESALMHILSNFHTIGIVFVMLSNTPD